MKHRSEFFPKLLFLGSAVIIFLCYVFIFKLFDKFDWNCAAIKFLLFAGIFGLVNFLKRKKAVSLVEGPAWIEIILLIGVSVFFVYPTIVKYVSWMHLPPRVDIGVYTQEAAGMFFKGGIDPYSKMSIIHPKVGFVYGPLMFIGYGLSAFFPQCGFKFTNLIYLIVSCIVLCVLSFEREKKFLQNVATVLFALTLFVFPDRFWYEIFTQGVNDLLPTLLILSALLFIKKDLLFLAGLMVGMSFSAKYPAAIVLFILFIRKDLNLIFFTGVLIGMVPVFIFLLWDARPFLAYSFAYPLTGAKIDSTSLYSITPVKLQYLFPIGQVVAIIFFIIKNFKKRIEYEAVVFDFLLLLIIIETLFKQMHINHLIWFMPLIALIFAKYRHGLFVSTNHVKLDIRGH